MSNHTLESVNLHFVGITGQPATLAPGRQFIVKGMSSGDTRVGDTDSPDDAATVCLPAIMTDRLLDFYDRFFAHPNTRDWYNCHRFALWMSTGELAQDPAYPYGSYAADHPRVVNIAHMGHPIEDQLSPGQHAVIAGPSAYFGGLKRTVHSLIGVGLPGTESAWGLQVTGVAGVVALSSLRDTLQSYRTDPDDARWQAYVLDAPSQGSE